MTFSPHSTVTTYSPHILRSRHILPTFSGHDIFSPPEAALGVCGGLGPTMTARGQSIGISTETLIMSRLDQLSRLGARI